MLTDTPPSAFAAEVMPSVAKHMAIDLARHEALVDALRSFIRNKNDRGCDAFHVSTVEMLIDQYIEQPKVYDAMKRQLENPPL